MGMYSVAQFGGATDTVVQTGGVSRYCHVLVIVVVVVLVVMVVLLIFFTCAILVPN